MASRPFEDFVLTSSGAEDGASSTAAARERWKRRLEALFTVKAPHKTQQDIERALDHFANPETGGWDEMWRQAIKKFGAEPSVDEVRRAFWRNKLSAYFLLVDSSQTPQDIEDCLDYFQSRLEGYEGMWYKVQRRYGLIVDINDSVKLEQERLIGDVVVERKQKSVLSGILPPRVVVIVVVAGISYRLYQAAPPAMQFKFNSAVASEVKYCAEFPNALTVCKVIEHVEGLTIEMETMCPEGTQSPGSLLVHYINSGSFPTGLIRKAYLEFIQGNPSKVFIMEGAVVESRQTANFRGNVHIRPEPSDGRLHHKLPSIDESRELVLARREINGPHSYAYVFANEGAQALYEPPPGAAAAGATNDPPASIRDKRVYPPPLASTLPRADERNADPSSTLTAADLLSPIPKTGGY